MPPVKAKLSRFSFATLAYMSEFREAGAMERDGGWTGSGNTKSGFSG